MTRREKALLRQKFGDVPLDGYKKRLEDGEPLAYILGEWYFYDEVYYVNPSVLIPRPETELLVEGIIKLLPEGGSFADLCTGSGCVAISALAHRPDATAFACDISVGAVETAIRNARSNGVAGRLEVARADVFDTGTLPAAPAGGGFDIIVSNPPYIATAVIPTLETVAAEPKEALDGGGDGLDFYRLFFSEYLDLIKPGGYMLLEIGYDQRGALEELCGETLARRTAAGKPGFTHKISRDYSGNDRILTIQINNAPS